MFKLFLHQWIISFSMILHLGIANQKKWDWFSCRWWTGSESLQGLECLSFRSPHFSSKSIHFSWLPWSNKHYKSSLLCRSVNIFFLRLLRLLICLFLQWEWTMTAQFLVSSTGEQIHVPCFHRYQLTVTWMSKIKDAQCKLGLGLGK